MAYFLGVDTGGTYTDAVIVDEAADLVIGKAKSLTTRAVLALGIGRAVDAALAGAGVAAQDVALVSLSTTLATNALVEGQGGRVALIFIGFDADDLERGGLVEALASFADAPAASSSVLPVMGGPSASMAEVLKSFDANGNLLNANPLVQSAAPALTTVPSLTNHSAGILVMGNGV